MSFRKKYEEKITVPRGEKIFQIDAVSEDCVAQALVVIWMDGIVIFWNCL